MGKVTWTGLLPPDDPIFKEGLTVSNAGSPKSIKTSLAGTAGAPRASKRGTVSPGATRKAVSLKEWDEMMFKEFEEGHKSRSGRKSLTDKK